MLAIHSIKKNVKNNNSYIKLAKLLLDRNNYKTNVFSLEYPL